MACGRPVPLFVHIDPPAPRSISTGICKIFGLFRGDNITCNNINKWIFCFNCFMFQFDIEFPCDESIHIISTQTLNDERI